MRQFVHPAAEDISLEGVLHALSDPTRLSILSALTRCDAGLSCSAAAPAEQPKSTLSHHYRILRESGLIRQERRGAEVVNRPRCADLEARFPGLVRTVLSAWTREASGESVEAA